MHRRPQCSKRLVLADGPGLGQIRADLEAFFRFSFWMAEQLEDLVAQWSHKAAPSAARRDNNSRLRAK
jgi:hypothetical protein